MFISRVRPRIWRRKRYAAIVARALALLLVAIPAVGNAAEADVRITRHVALNSIGYLPNAPKLATIHGDNGEQNRYFVRNLETGEVVLRGQLDPLGKPEDSERNFATANFTELRRAGQYQLSVPGVGDSAPFRVANNLYNWPFYCSLRAMYLWRCGCAVEGHFRGETFAHAACHLEDAYLDYADGPPGVRKDGVGGWHDAGDYNKYAVNGAFTAGVMLQAWEHFQDRLRAVKLDIPESANDVPDMLDEIRWETDWLLKMQLDDGRVYHKLSALQHGAFVLPEADTDRRYYSPWGTAATADFAAVMAHASRAFRQFDAKYADRCLSAAKNSYEFLKTHPQDHRPDLSAFSTGEYQTADADDRLWAAAQLWETTGEAEYLRDVEQWIRSRQKAPGRRAAIVDRNWDWSNVGNLGVFTYLLSQRTERDAALVKRVREQTLRVADEIVETSRRHPYGRTLGSTYYWGCNGTVVRLAMNLHVAQSCTGDSKYEAAMLDGLSHVLGRNPYGRSYVTGIGHRPPMLPHDRRSGGDQIVAPWPGYLVGGPWPTSDDWYDAQDDYRTNETAINWNGALIYALAAFVEPRDFDSSITAARQDPGADATAQP